MNLIVGTHTTPSENVGAIRRWGLIPRKPIEHNYRSFRDDESLVRQPQGVYMMLLNEPLWWKWSAGRTLHVTYVGPMMEDPLVPGGFIFLERVPPKWISL